MPTAADEKLKMAGKKTCVLVWMDEILSMAQFGKHALCADDHHGHQEDLSHGAHQGPHQGAEGLHFPYPSAGYRGQ
jgi:hypothetical protein